MKPFTAGKLYWRITSMAKRALVVKIQKAREDAKIPERCSKGAAGYDVFASKVLDRQTKKIIGGV